MQDNEIFNLLMLILMLENGGGTESINQLVITFLLLNSRNNGNDRDSRGNRCRDCNRDDGYTF